MVDIGFTKDDLWFRYRTGAIIVHDNKVLFCRNVRDGYYYFLGGAVNHGELSENCIERELLEETNLTVKSKELAVVLENFFMDRDKKGNLLQCHTLELYYKISVKNYNLEKEFTDTNEPLEWISLDEIKNKDIRPKDVANILDEIISSNKILHITSKQY